MAKIISSTVGKRGTVVIPAAIRRRFGLKEGDLLITEEREDGILLRPAVAMPLEFYSMERRASLLLENAVDEADYRQAREAVKQMGIDPDQIEHTRPDD